MKSLTRLNALGELRSKYICLTCLRDAAKVSSRKRIASWGRHGLFDVKQNAGPRKARPNVRNEAYLPPRLQRRLLLTRGGTAPTSLEEHDREVEKVAASVRSFYDRKEKFRIYHGSTNSTRESAMGRDPKTVVDTSRLNHVVSVDAKAQKALVEPNVPMDRLVEETLKHGLVPPVVMEFPGITVGGGYAGTAGESSSFKYGFFNETLNKVEMVLANGEKVTASKEQNPDLFHGAAGAVGTLGVTTMVELRLKKATKFVEATYHPVTSMQDAITKLQDFTSRPEDFDYIDGIMYSPTSGAIVTGKMTDTTSPNASVQRFSDPKDPWFYLYVRDSIAKNNSPTSDAIPLPDYLFRYDRGGFWVGEAPFDYFRFPFNNFTRGWLDDFLHTRMLYNALHASGRSEQMIIQDLALPYANAAEFVERMDNLTGIWPLWLCPLKQSAQPTMHPHYDGVEKDGKTLKPMLNIGLWGRAPPTHSAFVSANLSIEKTLQELKGMKWLYAQTFSSEPDFWKDFDKTWYVKLREKYHAMTLPTVYEKVKVADEKDEKKSLGKRIMEMWPIPGIVGLRRSIQSKDYVEARKAAWREWVPRE
ncbi:Delta(24)-sterol reductase [Fulvia fulva]|nr:Delta(24)-sterol reductase [Fulvia fulva]WPV17883.1 Delta(24)-sterol reductase [Fulvia fulva]WPV32841.1 Delta(24)-sterol reductase [Fulvia fulva]